MNLIVVHILISMIFPEQHYITLVPVKYNKIIVQFEPKIKCMMLRFQMIELQRMYAITKVVVITKTKDESSKHK